MEFKMKSYVRISNTVNWLKLKPIANNYERAYSRLSVQISITENCNFINVFK